MFVPFPNSLDIVKEKRIKFEKVPKTFTTHLFFHAIIQFERELRKKRSHDVNEGVVHKLFSIYLIYFGRRLCNCFPGGENFYERLSFYGWSRWPLIRWKVVAGNKNSIKTYFSLLVYFESRKQPSYRKNTTITYLLTLVNFTVAVCLKQFSWSKINHIWTKKSTQLLRIAVIINFERAYLMFMCLSFFFSCTVGFQRNSLNDFF